MGLDHPRFEVRSRLGSGAAGDVLRAWDRELEEEVAIKVLSQATDAQITRLRREVKVARRLMHPNIRPTYDLLDLPDGRRAVTMAYVKGRSLEGRLAEEPSPPLESCLAWMLQLAQALEHAHAEGVVHRDLKPANVLIREDDDEALLADFGVAAVTATNLRATQSGVVMGTPLYMAPEQLAGAGVDARADLYALGLVTLQCLEGPEPIRARWERPPRVRRADLPEAVTELLERLLAPEPDRRPDAGEVVRTLRSALAAQGWATEARTPTRAVPWAWGALLGSAVLALTAWAAWELGAFGTESTRSARPETVAPRAAPGEPAPSTSAPAKRVPRRTGSNGPRPPSPAPAPQPAPAPPPDPDGRDPKAIRRRFEPTPM